MKTPIRFLIPFLSLLPLMIQAADWPPPYRMPFGPGGNFPPYQMPPSGGYNFRPQAPDNARFMTPNYPAPYGYTQSPKQRQAPPRLEAELNKHRPYVQENTILTLRVVSDSNIGQLDPLLPQTEALAFQALTEPRASSRLVSGQQKIVNEIKYMVTPLVPGGVDLKPSVTVVPSDGERAGTRLTLQSAHALHLDIRPQVPGVTPWLPLEQLTLTSNMKAPPEVEPGKPVTLVLKLSAAGAIGNQLPNLERLLQSPDFRVYRGKTELEGGPSQNGRHIMGTRTEHYTLVPQYGGLLHLPSARISWFNVRSGSVEYASLPIKTLTTTGVAGDKERFLTEGDRFPKNYATGFWLPLMGVFLLLIGYWIGVWYKGQGKWFSPSFPTAMRILARSLSKKLGAGVRHAARRLNLRSRWNRALGRAADLLPTSVRFWFWVRCANIERDPALWRKTLQFLSWRQLALSPYASLPKVAEKVLQLQPRIDSEQLRQLLRVLDGAIYGKRPIDFEHWKQEFEYQVRPGIRSLGGRFTNARGGKPRLPPLNPTPV